MVVATQDKNWKKYFEINLRRRINFAQALKSPVSDHMSADLTNKQTVFNGKLSDKWCDPIGKVKV